METIINTKPPTDDGGEDSNTKPPTDDGGEYFGGEYAQGEYPRSRPRRLRQSPWLRDIAADVGSLTANRLILPIFVKEDGTAEAVKGMEAVSVYPLAELPKVAEAAVKSGLVAVALFPRVAANRKDAEGSEALNGENLICRSLALLKQRLPKLAVIADVALDPYTDHGHDGVLTAGGEVANDETVRILTAQALCLAEAGAAALAPSDMMDGRIGAIRTALDGAEHKNLPIISYTAKYASALYAPFRNAVGSAAALKGDKRTYQLNPSNRKEALRQAAADTSQGADVLMVKPALPYLDIIQTLSRRFPLPVFAYQVSGEYAMLQSQPPEALLECLTAIHRSGAVGIFSYGALAAAALLQNPR